ncbi:Predicted Rossmann fold nucleotide-binding protein [Nocardioides sp. YR527]|uniref:LOG family protein n=1 Tax=Nocardioides sp. YR527 TaxID=1881028 RepID=UPI000882979E|nr:LOG family protein [Nocardioides sp. YR527]SDK86709.1 Predicted Rossmann fold nucleotide-binding protein [Nocardioides sp. YR527]
MKHHRGRRVDIESVEELDGRVAAGAGSLRGWRLRALDLTSRSETLRDTELAGATFLDCAFAPGDGNYAEDEGALVMPVIPETPVDVHRSKLYTAEELYDDPVYARSLDARAYAWRQQPLDADDLLAITLHDHAIDTALEEWVRARRDEGTRLVGVMGGHALQRGEDGYASAARLAQHLASRHVIATGGGPGAMEAANLGAFLAGASKKVLEDALESLAAVPSFRPSIRAWAQVALDVRDRVEGTPGRSLGIPTWHYGHEPPNVFAGAIAKYFRNATREAVLLEVCDGGIVFLPGAGGTVQEIFQDACENYYADASAVAPMVLVGRSYWTEELPVWPLLQALARGRAMEGHIHLVDTAEEVLDVIAADAPG